MTAPPDQPTTTDPTSPARDAPAEPASPEPAPTPTTAAAASEPAPPRPVPAGPDTPTSRPRRGLGAAGRGRGATDVLSSPTTTPGRATPTNLKRSNRVLTLHPDTITRIVDSHMFKADLIMAALRTHGDTVRSLKASRPTHKGRQRFNVALNDHEYDQLKRLANHRGWSVSALVTVLTNLYLDQYPPPHTTTKPR